MTQLTSTSPSMLSDAAYAEAERAIDAAVTRFPDLSTPQVPDVALALAFLTQCTRTKTAGFPTVHLTVAIEQWAALHGVYTAIAHSGVLAAAVALGFTIRRAAVTQVGVSAPSVRRMLFRPLVVAGREVR